MAGGAPAPAPRVVASPVVQVTSNILSALNGGLEGRFGRELGGWQIVDAPGGGFSPALDASPDLAGYRHEPSPTPSKEAARAVPDWVCEVATAASLREDLLVKRPAYARAGVRHYWFVDLLAQVLSAYRLENGLWVELGSWGDETNARIEPFDAVPLDVHGWWPLRDSV